MDRLSQNLRHAIARLIRDRAFAAITIVTLALGIGANTAVFSLVKASLMSPLPYGDADRLTAIWGPDRGEVDASLVARGLYLPARVAELRRHCGLPGIRRELYRRTGTGVDPRRIGDAQSLRGDAHVRHAGTDVHAGRYRGRHEQRDRDQPRAVAAPLRRRRRHHRPIDPGERPRAHHHRRDAGVVPPAERLRLAASDGSVGAGGRQSRESRRLGQPIVLRSRAIEGWRVGRVGIERVAGRRRAMGQGGLRARASRRQPGRTRAPRDSRAGIHHRPGARLVVDSVRLGGVRVADRVRECGEPAAGARGCAASRGRGAHRARRGPRSHRADSC